MESHKEKQEIFNKLSNDRYKLDFNSFLLLILDEVRDYETTKDRGAKKIENLIFEACDLVQAEQQERIASQSIVVTRIFSANAINAVEESVINNPENLIK
ncbi:hypothetical protein SAMN05421866_4200 [Chryseobacterium oranimense]|uniref:Uncharacterized protein n=1 Tax=Chryseobacterium oranimense TaxID=421058 RepID=A0A1M5WSV2_9FLAO|nr:hypothetical protein [Chryseobacterium oranimense]SHH90093.1 hypothetical protein SAMN05421866_4200 [Chryseobacterium oranimense]